MLRCVWCTRREKIVSCIIKFEEKHFFMYTKGNMKEKQHGIVEVEQMKFTSDATLTWSSVWQAEVMTSASLCYGFHVGKQKRLKGTLKRIKIIFVENLSSSFSFRGILFSRTMTLFRALVEWDFNVQLRCGYKLLKLLYVSSFKHHSTSSCFSLQIVENVLKTLLIAVCAII